MRGPIDYIIVGFEGKKFDGSILKSLVEPLEKKIIKLIAIAAVSRDEQDHIVAFDIKQVNNKFIVDFADKYKPEQATVELQDLFELAELIKPNCTAGLLVVEYLWAKPLKKAIIDSRGVLLAEGRIHPETALELETN